MTEPVEFWRQVDDLGRIVLPRELRRCLDLTPHCTVEIVLDAAQGQLTLRKASRQCMRCGSASGLREIKPRFYLCSACLRELE